MTNGSERLERIERILEQVGKSQEQLGKSQEQMDKGLEQMDKGPPRSPKWMEKSTVKPLAEEWVVELSTLTGADRTRHRLRHRPPVAVSISLR